MQPDETSLALIERLEDARGELAIALYGTDESFDLSPYSHAKIEKIASLSKPFRALPRDNDMVIFKDIFLAHESQKMILKAAYHTLANTAHIIIIEKKGLLNIEATKELLERNEFRAPNEIECLEGHDLIMAKKMHMWGNGL
ncbi:MAG: hypothetical protein IE916_11350 [Epsilonproteobacteria bacterium]|nr:hypothetical protein [Campylobacterota bacterium]